MVTDAPNLQPNIIQSEKQDVSFSTKAVYAFLCLLTLALNALKNALQIQI